MGLNKYENPAQTIREEKLRNSWQKMGDLIKTRRKKTSQWFTYINLFFTFTNQMDLNKQMRDKESMTSE